MSRHVFAAVIAVFAAAALAGAMLGLAYAVDAAPASGAVPSPAPGPAVHAGGPRG